jgi:hypothetical protein
MLRAIVLAAQLLVAAPAGDTVLDAALAEVEDRVVTASDVALARAFRLFGAAPSSAPITADEVERFVGAWVIVHEARRLGIGPSPEEVDRAWRDVEAGLGGPARLEAWLRTHAVGTAWPRRLVEDHLRWERFIDLRFRTFVFVTEDQVSARLGAGPHTAAARDQARARLIEAETQQRLGAWVAGAIQRARVLRLVAPGTALPSPLPMPGDPARPAAGRRRTIEPASPIDHRGSDAGGPAAAGRRGPSRERTGGTERESPRCPRRLTHGGAPRPPGRSGR